MMMMMVADVEKLIKNALDKVKRLFMKNLLPQYKSKITASVNPRKYTVLSLSSDNSNVYTLVQSHCVNPIGTYIVSTQVLNGDVDSAVYIVLYLATGGEVMIPTNTQLNRVIALRNSKSRFLALSIIIAIFYILCAIIAGHLYIYQWRIVMRLVFAILSFYAFYQTICLPIDNNVKT